MTEPSGLPPAPAPAAPRSGRVLVLVLAVVVLVIGALVGVLVRAGEDDGASADADRTVATPPVGGSTAPTTPTRGLGEGFAPAQRGRTPLRGFGEVVATITDASGETCQVCLLAARTDAQRERGLMEVTDKELGGYDGMVFVYPEPIDGAFWMRNTPMPLSIAYFDGRGELVSTTDMAPCRATGVCPVYPSEGRFRYALEVPRGRLGRLLVAEGSRIELGVATCPVAAPRP